MAERTTIVSFETGGGDDKAELFTSSPKWMEILDALITRRSDCYVTDIVKDQDGKILGKHYSFPQKFLILSEGGL